MADFVVGQDRSHSGALAKRLNARTLTGTIIMGIATLKVKGGLPLNLAHLHELQHGSGLNTATIRGMQCRTVASKVMADAVGMSPGVKMPRYGALDSFMGTDWSFGPCLELPYLDPDGKPIGYARYKPTNPRTDGNRDGREIKYEAPWGTAPRLYIPPGAGRWLKDPTKPLAIVEGEKKAACGQQEAILCVGIAGVWAWKLKGQGLLPDFDWIDFKGRLVYLVPDSDYKINRHVRKAMHALAAALQERGAVVLIVRLPDIRGDGKTGLDDFIVAQGGDELRQLLSSALLRLETQVAVRKRTKFSVYIEEPPLPPTPLTEKLVRFDFDTGIPCEHIHRRLLEHIERKHDAALGFTCKRWGCEGCCPRLQQHWNDHCVGLMENLHNQGQAAYVFHGRDSDWNRVRQLLKRCGGNYLRVARVGWAIKHLEGFRFLITRIDSLTVVSDRPFKGAVRTDAPDAAVALTNAIRAFRPDNSSPRLPDGSHQRISTSRKWKSRQEDERKYTDQGPVYRDQKQLVTEAKRLGVYAAEWEEPPEGVADGTDLYHPSHSVGAAKERIRDEIAGRKPGWRERPKIIKAVKK